MYTIYIYIYYVYIYILYMDDSVYTYIIRHTLLNAIMAHPEAIID